MLHNSFELDWDFFYGDLSPEELCGTGQIKWQKVDIPHDYARNHFFRNDPTLDCAGYLPGGTGCYRKEFFLENCRDTVTSIEFDGICGESTIFCNGKKVGEHHFFYDGFSLDLTGFVREGLNLLAVKVFLPMPSGRWYTGAGINRHCRILQKSPFSLKRNGMEILSKIEESGKKAKIKVNLEFEKNPSSRGVLSIIRPDGSCLEKRSISIESNNFSAEFTEASPQLWNPGSPLLYTAELETTGKVYREKFGLRKVEFTSKGQMLINAIPTPIQGVAIHEGFGCLGTAFSEEALERIFSMIREIGANAIRTVHNPPPPELIRKCDAEGIMVMLELFDCWERGKVEHDFHKYFRDEWQSVLEETARAFRNSPSIILWSIGNEVREQGSPDCGRIANMLSGSLRKLVPGAIITCGCDMPKEVIENNILPALDVLGINYNLSAYGEAAKSIPVYGSENVASLASRGAFALDENGAIIGSQSDHEESSYSITKMGNGNFQEEDLLFHKESPHSPGEFAWCLFDYLGEGLHRTDNLHIRNNGNVFYYPARSTYWGFFDTCGFPKDRVWLYRSLWKKAPCAHLMPHWTWPGKEGKIIPVWAYGNFDSCELFLNGRSLGKTRFAKGKLHGEFQVPYEPGVLELKGYDKEGNIIAGDTVKTAGKLHKLELLPDKVFIEEDGLSFIEVRAVDEENTLLPDANNSFEVKVEGGGTLYAADNGDACNHEKFDASEHSFYHGMALLVIRQKRGNKEDVKVSLHLRGREPFEITLPVKEKQS